MGRAIAGVVVGYLTMVVIVMVSFTIAYLALGAEGAFQPGSFEVSTPWIAISFVLGLVAAVAGGWICQTIAGGRGAAIALIVLVVVLGLLLAIPVLRSGEPPGPRSGELGSFEAMQQARQPAWVALLNPFVGAVGVGLGARIRRG